MIRRLKGRSTADELLDGCAPVRSFDHVLPPSQPGLDLHRIRLAGSKAATETAETRFCGSDAPMALVVSVPARLETFDVFVESEGAQGWQVQTTVTDIVAGDTLVIQWQSNAVAGLNPTDPAHGKANGNRSPFIRSFGTQSPDPTLSENDRVWHEADGDLSGRSGSVGQWGLRLARQLLDEYEIPSLSSTAV